MQLIPNKQVSSTDTSPFRHVYLNYRFLQKSWVQRRFIQGFEIVNFKSQKVNNCGDFSVTEWHLFSISKVMGLNLCSLAEKKT